MPTIALRDCAFVIAAGLSLAFAAPAHADILVTPAEGRLPPAVKAGPVSRAITRGPRIEFTSLTDPSKSPVRLRFKFEAFGGAAVNLNSLRLMYLKNPLIDLTDRIKPYVKADGIDMPQAEFPVGEHQMRLELSDSDGRTAISNIFIKIAP